MLTVLATLPFVLGFALAASVVIQLLREDGAKVRAALKGESLLATPVLTTPPVVVRMNSRPRRPTIRRLEPLQRAAA